MLADHSTDSGARVFITVEEIARKDNFAFMDAVGRWFSGRLLYYVDLATLFYLAFKELIAERKKGRSLIFEITLRQIFFTGVQAMKLVTLVSLLLGTMMIIQIGSHMSLLGGVGVMISILIMMIVREFGPLITAFIVIARSGTAIATELGNMIVAHELEAIESMGINPISFVVAPRIIGVAVAVVCLTVYFIAVALIGGFLVSKLTLTISLPVFIRELAIRLQPVDMILPVLKGLLFGLLIPLICAYHGLTVRYSSIEVPQATTRAVVSAILFCFVTSLLLSLLAYL